MKKNNIQKMPKAGQAGNGTKPHVSSSADVTMDFGGFILGEVWAKRLVNKPDCWYHNNRKVSIVDLYRKFNKGR